MNNIKKMWVFGWRGVVVAGMFASHSVGQKRLSSFIVPRGGTKMIGAYLAPAGASA